MKSCVTFYEAQTAILFKEIIQPLPTHLSHDMIKSYYLSGTEIFLRKYTEI